MPLRRLDERIRDLCARAIKADESELEQILEELKAALHQHTERLRKLAAEKLGHRRVA